MITTGDSTVRMVGEISPAQEQRIIDFLQGAVYCWCKNRKGEWFSMRDLMGGDYRDWDNTPLMVLYSRHLQNGKTPEEAFLHAGIDSGWMLKKVVHCDTRPFETQEDGQIRKYRWILKE
jgi:hypothetical protein